MRHWRPSTENLKLDWNDHLCGSILGILICELLEIIRWFVDKLKFFECAEILNLLTYSSFVSELFPVSSTSLIMVSVGSVALPLWLSNIYLMIIIIPLSKRRENSSLILFHKIINNLAAVPHSCLEKADVHTRKNHAQKFCHIGYNVDLYGQSSGGILNGCPRWVHITSGWCKAFNTRSVGEWFKCCNTS